MNIARLTLAAVLAAAVALPAAAQTPAAAGTEPVLELSLAEVVERALKNNTDIAVQRYSPEIDAADVKSIEGSYDVVLTGDVNTNSNTSPARNAFTGGDTVDTDTWTFDFGASKLLGTGGSLRVDYLNSKQDTNSVYSVFNPTYNATIGAALTQPLARNFKTDSVRTNLRVAKLNRAISDEQFRQVVTNTVALAKSQYYDISLAIDNLAAKKKSLALAEKLLSENRIKVKVGTLAPLDVVEAEAEVASRAEGVIQAEALLASVQDNLRQTLAPANDPVLWSTRIVPSERPTAAPPSIDVEAAIRTALQGRTDVVAARKGLERSDVNLRFAKNQLLPAVDLVASYSGSGVGGTTLIRDGFGGPVIETIPGGYGDAAGDAFSFDFPNWVVGVKVSVPLGNRTAKGNEARARLSKEQAETAMKRLELSVVSEVRAAARNLEAGYKSVEATRAARVLATRRLEAEEKRFAAGMSTSFLVTQAQRDLADAEVNEIRAVASYTKYLINFERVQVAGGYAGFLASTSTTVAAN